MVPFIRRIRISVWIMLGLALTACGGPASASINRVTPLPADFATPAPTAVVTVEPVAAANASLPTPTPLAINLPEGAAAALALATDTALQPTPRSRVSFTESPVRLTFEEFYDGYNMRTGLILSDKLVSLDGQQVVIEGYMAPPLKPKLDYFVLTEVRMDYCPYCSTAADWPRNIALIYMLGDPVEVTQQPIRLTGRIEVGQSIDQETGMVSLVRIYANKLEVL